MWITILAAMAALQTPTIGPVRPAQLSEARTALDERLFDLPSARFRDVRGNSLVLCGFVNAKNRMGAYAGWKRFAWITVNDDPSLEVDGAGSTSDIMLDAFCGEDGRKQIGPDLSDRMLPPNR